MKTDVVYKLGSGSLYNNKELLYSLRSLSNFKDLGNVYIIGFKPNWIKNVIHIPAIDVLTSNKDGNLIFKLLMACYQPDITESFLNMSDDQIFLKECCLEDFKNPFYNNNLYEFRKDKRLNRWQNRLQATQAVLQAKGLSFNCFESHIPTLLNKQLYIRAIAQYDYVNGRGLCGNTLYFNTLGIKGREIDDSVSLMNPALPTVEAIEKVCEKGKFFNYTENSVNNQLFEFLDKKFPLKSLYEEGY